MVKRKVSRVGVIFFFQAEDGIRDHCVTGVRRVLFRSLSSKFFSTFPHGTCPLSDTCQYLALDGVYHPLWAAFPNNPTPGTTKETTTDASRGLTPAMGGPDQGGLGRPHVAAEAVPNATVLANAKLGDSALGSCRFTRRY